MNAFDGQGRLLEAALDAGARRAIREALALAEDSTGTGGTRSSQCKPGHMLLALLRTSIGNSEERARVLRAALKPPARLEDMDQRIRSYVGDLDLGFAEFDLTR